MERKQRLLPGGCIYLRVKLFRKLLSIWNLAPLDGRRQERRKEPKNWWFPNAKENQSSRSLASSMPQETYTLDRGGLLNVKK